MDRKLLFEDYSKKPTTNIKQIQVSGSEVEETKQFTSNRLKRFHDDSNDYSKIPVKKVSIEDAFLEKPNKKINNNQKQSSQKYRQNQKEKSVKLSQDLNVEEEKNKELLKIRSELQIAIKSLSKVLATQTKVSNVDNLMVALKANELAFTAETFVQELHQSQQIIDGDSLVCSNQVTIMDTSVETQVEIPSGGVDVDVDVDVEPSFMPLNSVEVPVNSFNDNDDCDCEYNNFQELFMHQKEPYEIESYQQVNAPVLQQSISVSVESFLNTDCEFDSEILDQLLQQLS